MFWLKFRDKLLHHRRGDRWSHTLFHWVGGDVGFGLLKLKLIWQFRGPRAGLRFAWADALAIYHALELGAIFVGGQGLVVRIC